MAAGNTMLRWRYMVPANTSERSCFITFLLLTHLITSASTSWWPDTGPVGQLQAAHLNHAFRPPPCIFIFPLVSTSASSVVVYFLFSNRCTAFRSCRGHRMPRRCSWPVCFQSSCWLCWCKTEKKGDLRESQFFGWFVNRTGGCRSNSTQRYTNP